jgi:hypothetical protein
MAGSDKATARENDTMKDKITITHRFIEVPLGFLQTPF